MNTMTVTNRSRAPYYLHLLFSVGFLMASFSSISQGNSCATATALNNNGCTNGEDLGFCSWTAAGGGIVDPSCGGPYTDGQGWYTITTSATANSWVVEVKQTTGGGSNPVDDPAFQIYSGTCGALTEIGCYNDDAGSGVDEKVRLSLSNSTTYYIRVVDADGNMTCSGGGKNYEYEICFYDYEPGDDCDNAIDLGTNNTSCGYTTYDNGGFISSDEVDPTCALGAGAEDMWFKVTTDATGTIAVDLRPGTLTNSGLEIYSGGCGALTSLGCNDDKGLCPTYPNCLMSRLEGTLTPNTDYFARVWGDGGGTGTFELCNRTMPAPAEDVCSSAQSLTVGTTYTQTIWGATVDASTDPATGGCNGSLDNSVWYTFTTGDAGTYYVNLTDMECSQGTGTQTDVGSWSGAACTSANWSSEGCGNTGDCSDYGLSIAGLSASTTYYVFIDGWGAMGERTEFDITITYNSPLPVELVSFDAVSREAQVDLKWLTATELNNDYFLVERSQDSKTWEAVGIINGKGNSQELTDYTLVDEDPYPGRSYYRLKQVDYDGTAQFFNVRTVDRGIDENAFSVYPNPVNDVLFIKGTSQLRGMVDLVISNTLGQTIVNKQIEAQDLQEITLQKSGLYHVSITGEGFIFQKSVVKK